MWWLPVVSLLALGMLAYVFSALHVLVFSPLVVGRQAREREAAARAAQAPPVPRASVGSRTAAPPTIRLEASGHPGSPRFTIPVPHDARLPEAGRGEGDRPSRDRIVLATSGDAADVLAFYRDELGSDGWREVRA